MARKRKSGHQHRKERQAKELAKAAAEQQQAQLTGIRFNDFDIADYRARVLDTDGNRIPIALDDAADVVCIATNIPGLSKSIQKDNTIMVPIKAGDDMRESLDWALQLSRRINFQNGGEYFKEQLQLLDYHRLRCHGLAGQEWKEVVPNLNSSDGTIAEVMSRLEELKMENKRLRASLKAASKEGEESDGTIPYVPSELGAADEDL